jgi:hypothetical protein
MVVVEGMEAAEVMAAPEAKLSNHLRFITGLSTRVCLAGEEGVVTGEMAGREGTAEFHQIFM